MRKQIIKEPVRTAFTVLKKPSSRMIRVEIDVDQWERISAGLGLFRKEFLMSLDRAERQIVQGKGRVLSSFKDLRES